MLHHCRWNQGKNFGPSPVVFAESWTHSFQYRIYKRYGNVNTILRFQVTLGVLFLCSCLTVILGAETVAPNLSASLDASSNHSWHSSSMFDLTLATAFIVSSIIEYAWKTSWSFFWSFAAIGLSVPRLFFGIKKVKLNPNVFKFARRLCGLVLVSLSHVNDNEE